LGQKDNIRKILFVVFGCLIILSLVLLVVGLTGMVPRLNYTLTHYEQLDQGQILSQLVTVVEGTTYLANFFWNALAVLLALAALFTCVFVVMSRRAILRQIHASLGDIADQLKVLSQTKRSD